ncbi:hypothetical protein VTK56DRAFT_6280 [Thermocarpiscus australiensis]
MTDRGAEALSASPLPSSAGAPYVRLHVSPLDPELLKVILSSALLPKARNISYHTIETFPEKRYGFLELPNDDADKLRKKLNGAVLKGVKIRIERARPSGIPAPLGEEAMAKEKKERKEKPKKRKRGAEELSGVVLEDGRKVKRGWTTADEPKEKRPKKNKEKYEKKGNKEKKKQAKSKYTDHAECLVKTVLPPNVATSTEAGSSKNKKKKSREVTVHEFEKTTKFPTFLKTAASAGRPRTPLQFVDEQGWVDEGGNLVEAVKTRPPPTSRVSSSNKDRLQETGPDEQTAMSSSDSDSESEESQPDIPAPAGDDNPASMAAESEASPPSPSSKSDPPRPRSSGTTKDLSIKIPPATPNGHEVHPLEALYKHPQQPNGQVTASDTQGFSFFADGNDEDDLEEDGGADAGDTSSIQVPLTPFTRQDLELRGIRSAAPTPDTAHPNRRFKPWESDDESGEGEDEDPAYGHHEDDQKDLSSNTAAAQAAEDDGKAQSEFQRWFWENRGDLNRAWRKRRKLAGKEKRYRENKARMARAI